MSGKTAVSREAEGPGRPDTYFIRPDYETNAEVITENADGEREYWHAGRIYSSRFYQYPVYGYAAKVIRRYGLKSVIDVGCGVATKLAMLHARLPEVSITGIDQASAIAYCREHYRFGTWHVGNLADPSAELQELKADLVVCADVIEHLSHPEVLLAYLEARVTPAGYILLSTPERDALRGGDARRPGNRFHIREWNFAELASFLSHSGFEVVEHFVQYPVRIYPNRIFWNEIGKRLLRGKGLKYNQVALLKVR